MLKSLIYSLFIASLFIVNPAQAGAYTDCNVSDLYVLTNTSLVKDVHFNYSSVNYYEMADFPLVEEGTYLGITQELGAPSTSSLLWDVTVNGMDVATNVSPNSLVHIPFTNTSCDGSNKIVVTAHDSYAQYVNIFGMDVLARSEACDYTYKCYLYNPPCF